MVCREGESSSSDQANNGWQAWIFMAESSGATGRRISVTIPPAEQRLVEKSRKIGKVGPGRQKTAGVLGEALADPRRKPKSLILSRTAQPAPFPRPPLYARHPGCY